MPHPLEEDRTPPPFKPAPPRPPTRARPLLFMIWLIGMILFALYAAYVWSGAISSLRREYSDVLVYGALGLLILQIFAELGILFWKRWGVYGLIGALLINLVLRLLLGTVDDISVAVFVLAAAMLWWVVRPNWTLYTW